MTVPQQYSPAVRDHAAKVVRALMEWHGMTQSELAEATMLGENTLNRRLAKKPGVGHEFKVGEIEVLAWFFDRPVVEFFNGDVNLAQSRLPGDPDRKNIAFLMAEPKSLTEALIAA